MNRQRRAAEIGVSCTFLQMPVDWLSASFRKSSRFARTSFGVVARLPRLGRRCAVPVGVSIGLFAGQPTGLSIGLLSAGPAAAEDCTHRGDLDAPFCDQDHDLIADRPTDPSALRSPRTLVFSYTPIEEPALYERLLRPFTAHLSQCMGRRVVYFPVQSNVAQIEAMRSGRVQVSWFSTGPTAYAVNVAGAVPFAAKGNASGLQGYQMLLVARADRPWREPADLRGRRVAHTSPSSNSGHLAARALLPGAGLRPGTDYEIKFSGKHDRSVLGVLGGEYDAAVVASDILERMVRRGQVPEGALRVLFRSERFPTEAVAHSHDLAPELQRRLRECFQGYRFPPALREVFDDADRFVQVDYARDWTPVRAVAARLGERFDRPAYDRTFRPAR